MAHFIEELNNGECFESLDTKYIITCDFKRGGKRLSINLIDGSTRWFNSNDIVEKISLFYMNKDNLMVAIKELKKDDIAT